MAVALCCGFFLATERSSPQFAAAIAAPLAPFTPWRKR